MGKYFGTDGIRGDANRYINDKLCYRLGRFIGQYLKNNKIVIGRDTRLSGKRINSAIIDGLLKSGADIFDVGITTTPSISYFVEKHDFDFGIMISASHNPFYDNGIKIFAKTGEKLPSDIEELIEKYIDTTDDYLPMFSYSIKDNYHDASQLIDEYLNYVSSKKTFTKKYKVLVDCARGSASVIADHFFKTLLKVDATIVNSKFDGTDINLDCGSTHISNLLRLMKSGSYDIGFAFDGDADRLIAVSNRGEIIDGDNVIASSAVYLKTNGELNNNKVVITSMSNLGLKKYLNDQDIGVLIVDVGDKYVQNGLKENNLVLGGEQSGHVIFYNELNTGCGLISAVKVLNIMDFFNISSSKLKNMMMTYPQVLNNVKVKNKMKICDDVRLLNLCKEIDEELKDNGRLLVRPSGTEQLIRVMVEAKDIDTCRKYANKVANLIAQIDANQLV